MERKKSYHRLGQGPARLPTLGGKGRRLRYENGAADWWVHAALCSVHRLRLLTWLCTHPGEHPVADIARGLAITRSRAHIPLMSLRWHGLAEARWVPAGPRPTGDKRQYHWLWSTPQLVRLYLWRFGWVAGRLVPGIWRQDTWYGETDVDPCAALLADASNHLLRPTSLAAAYLLWTAGPISVRRMAQLVGHPENLVEAQLIRWQRQGWAVWKTGPRFTDGDTSRARQPRVWSFRREGLSAMERHCHALRWASQHSGYIPPPDDRFFLGEDRANWLVGEFTTE
jgi:hypothetical protein